MTGSKLSTLLAFTLCLLHPSNASKANVYKKVISNLDEIPSEWIHGATKAGVLDKTPYLYQECMRETKVIQANHNIQEKLRMCLMQGVEGQLGNCHYTSQNEFNCNILYKGSNVSTNAYHEMCDRAHGHVIYRTLELFHNHLGLFTFNVSMEWVPQCVGLNCTQVEVGPEQLRNPIFNVFMNANEKHDLCAGEVGFWDSLGMEIASWAGVDLPDCSKDEERYLRGLPIDPLDLEGPIDVFDGDEEDQAN